MSTELLIGRPFLAILNLRPVSKRYYIARDACFLNLLVDSTKLVPDGDVSFHEQLRSEDLSRRLTPVERRSVAPLKYFFIDFETAIRFSTDDKNPR